MNIPSSMPTEQRQYVEEEYQKFMKQRKEQKQQQQQQQQRQQQQQQQQPQEIPKAQGFSPKKFGMFRMESNSTVPLNDQVLIPGGTFWFGSQTDYKGKIAPAKSKDGAAPRKKATVRYLLFALNAVFLSSFESWPSPDIYVPTD